MPAHGHAVRVLTALVSEKRYIPRYTAASRPQLLIERHDKAILRAEHRVTHSGTSRVEQRFRYSFVCDKDNKQLRVRMNLVSMLAKVASLEMPARCSIMSGWRSSRLDVVF